MKDKKILKLTELAILVAIIVVMSFTPLGYLRYGLISITFLMIPIAIGGIVIGPGASAILGLAFGITSIAQTFGIDAFGTTLMSINPFGTFVVLVVARVLAGFLCGVIYKGISKACKVDAVNMAVTSFSASALNTLFYVSFILLFFGQDSQVGETVWASLTLILLLNAVVEAIACTIVGTAVSLALKKAIKY